MTEERLILTPTACEPCDERENERPGNTLRDLFLSHCFCDNSLSKHGNDPQEAPLPINKNRSIIEALPLCADLGDDPSEHEIRAWLQKALQSDKRAHRILFSTSQNTPKKEIRETPCLKPLPMLYYEHSSLRGEMPACRVET